MQRWARRRGGSRRRRTSSFRRPSASPSSAPRSTARAFSRSASARATSRARPRSERNSRTMSALEVFERTLAGKDQGIELARACLLIAQDAYPSLDVERYLGEIEGMALRLRARLKNAGG